MAAGRQAGKQMSQYLDQLRTEGHEQQLSVMHVHMRLAHKAQLHPNHTTSWQQLFKHTSGTHGAVTAAPLLLLP
jgi:hypothetical protein